MKNFIKRPGVWGTIVSLAVIALVAFAYFYPDASAGRVLNQHDVMQGMANGQEITAYAEQTGHTSYWTNSLFGGMPTFQISPAYPSGKLFSWITTVYGFGLPAPSNLLAMMMTGMFILLMVMRCRWPLALAGAVAWGLSSYFVILIGAGHIWKFVTLAYVPPTIAGLVLIYRGKRVLGAGVAALFMMMQIASNHVQMSYYFAWVMAGFVIAYGISALKEKKLKQWGVSTLVAAGAMLLAVGANMPNLYNTYEYSKQTIRGQHSELTSSKSDATDATGGLDRSYITQYSYEPSETFTLLIPNLKGGTSAATVASTDEGKQLMKADRTGQMALLQVFSQYFGGEEGTSGPVYVGAIIVALFIFGAIVVRGPLKWALVVLTLLSVLLAWGRHMMWFTDLFIDWMPMYNKFRTVESILVIAEFTMPLLGILGLRELFAAQPEKRKTMLKPMLWSFGACIFLCLIAVIWPGIYGQAVLGPLDEKMVALYVSAGALPEGFSMMQFPEVVNAVESIRLEMVSADGLRSLLFLGVAAIAIWGLIIRKINVTATVAIVGLAVLVDLYGADKRYLNTDSFSAPAPQKGFVASVADKAILADPDQHYRVLDVNGFSTANSSYFHKTIGGYHAAKLTRYQDLIERQIMPGLQSGDLRAVNMLNAKYIITNPNQAPVVNEGALGNAWFVDNIDYAGSADEEMALLGEIDPATEAVADKAFEPVLGQVEFPADSTDSIVLTSYAPDKLTYRADSKRGGLAVFSEVYFPWGWTATVDGEEVPIGRVNYLLRALRLPAGSHKITMVFDPKSLRVTDSLAMASAGAIYLILLLGIVGGVIFRRKQKV